MPELTPAELFEKTNASPADPEAYLALGLALHKEGKLQDALDAFSRGLAENPFHVLLRQQRARKNMARNPWLALSDFVMVTRIAPSYWEGWYYMGVTCFLNDMQAKSRDCFTRCLAEARVSGASLIPVIDWLYTVHMKLGETREAQTALSLFTDIQADPAGEDYSYARRIMLYKGLLTSETFFDEDTLNKRDSGGIDWVTQAYGLANICFLHGETDKSVALLKDILAHDQYPTAFAFLLARKDLKDRGIEI